MTDLISQGPGIKPHTGLHAQQEICFSVPPLSCSLPTLAPCLSKIINKFKKKERRNKNSDLSKLSSWSIKSIFESISIIPTDFIYECRRINGWVLELASYYKWFKSVLRIWMTSLGSQRQVIAFLGHSQRDLPKAAFQNWLFSNPLKFSKVFPCFCASAWYFPVSFFLILQWHINCIKSYLFMGTLWVLADLYK